MIEKEYIDFHTVFTVYDWKRIFKEKKSFLVDT
jgi:hypothetical protein